MARTDLVAPDQTDQLAGSPLRSLHDRIPTLPDDLAVYPTHGAGSFCSAPAGAERTTTIGPGEGRQPAAQRGDEDAFVGALLRGLGTHPPYLLRLREVNRRGPQLVGSQPPALPRLLPSEVRRLVMDGAVLIDARPMDDVAASHVAGSLSLAMRGQFATGLGWLVDPDRRLLLLLAGERDELEVLGQALKIGYEHFAGRQAGGIEAWRATGLPLNSLPIIAAAAVAEAVLDVRLEVEFAGAHLPGADQVVLGALADVLPQAPGGVTVMCGHGERAMFAASILAAAGRRDLTVAVGGPEDWAAAQDRPLQAGR